MKKLLTFALLGLAASMMICGGAVAQVSVCDVRSDADDNCVADNLDIEVTVQGVVLAWKQFGVRGPGAIWDPVSGCCISVFDITDAPDVAIGNMVTVTGWVGAFSGLDEIVDNPADGTMDPTVTDDGAGPTAPIIPLQALELADLSPLAEGLESGLVELCGEFVGVVEGDLFAGNTNYDFMDGLGNTCAVRIDFDTEMVGLAIPIGSVALTGVLAQFDEFGANICGGYQVLPRFLNDIVPGECEIIATEQKSWGGIKDLYR